jgi:hypothetical protein
MRKTFVAIIAAGAVGVVWADATTNQEQFRDQPEARAYFSYTFGGQASRSQPAPLHYGLRLDHDSRMNAVGADGIKVQMPALLQFDHDNRGESLASANGVPFAGLNLRVRQDGMNAYGLHQNDSGSSDSTNAGGWTFFDWSLLAIGLGGAGYLIYDATKGKDSPDGKSTSSTTGGSSTGGGLLGLGLLGLADNATSYDLDERDFERQRWLDGGTGQMGDLGGR